jgi:hypothetical protein
MHKNLLIVSIAGLSFVLPALASDRSDDAGRIQKATQVFQEIMRTPDQGIPQELLETAKCVAIIPGEEKAAFIFGGSYGKGLATCRTAHGWSTPMLDYISEIFELADVRASSHLPLFHTRPTRMDVRAMNCEEALLLQLRCELDATAPPSRTEPLAI